MNTFIKPKKLITDDEAYHFLKNKFDAIEGELIFWLAPLPRYGSTGVGYNGNNIVDEPLFYDKDTIENVNFEKDHPHPCIKKILRSDIEGNIISGLEAAALLRKKGYDDVAVRNFLGSLDAFKNNPRDANKTLILNTNVIEKYENLFYSENTIIEFIPAVELQYVSLQSIINEREPWKNFKELEIVNLLTKCIEGKKLRVYDENCACPSYTKNTIIGKNGDGKEITQPNKIYTDHYGQEAQALIDSRNAMFQLSEILEVESNHFTKQKHVYFSEEHNLNITKKLFEDLSNSIMSGKANPIHNRSDLANIILEMGNKQGLYKKSLKATTIEAYINKLGIKKPQWSKLTKTHKLPLSKS